MILRLTGYFFLCLAMAAFAYDGMRMIADNGQLTFTSVEEHWLAISPGTLESARQIVSSISSYLWSPLLMAVLILPAWMVSGGLGVLIYLAGYRPPAPPLPEGI